MNDYLERARKLLGDPGKEALPQERIDLLVRALESAVDEIYYLRQRVQRLERDAGRTTEDIHSDYVRSRMESRFSAAGAVPWSVLKWRNLLETRNEMAERLIPDPKEREETIHQLSTLT